MMRSAPMNPSINCYQVEVPTLSAKSKLIVEQEYGCLKFNLHSSGDCREVPIQHIRGLPSESPISFQFFQNSYAVVGDHSIRFNSRLKGGGILDFLYTPRLDTTQAEASGNRIIDRFGECLKDKIELAGEVFDAKVIRNFEGVGKELISDIENKALHVVGNSLSGLKKVIKQSSEVVREDVKGSVEENLRNTRQHLSLAFKEGEKTASDLLELCKRNLSGLEGEFFQGIEKNIELSSLRVQNALTRGRNEAYNILEKANKELIQSTFKELDALVEKVEKTTESLFKKLIEEIGSESRALIFEVKNAAKDVGKLLIRDFGSEIRVTASKFLAETYAYQVGFINHTALASSILIGRVGEEARMTLLAVPRIAATSGRSFGKGVSVSINEFFKGRSPADQLEFKIQTHLANASNSERGLEKGELISLLGFIRNQTHITASRKVNLYNTVVDEINDPSFNKEVLEYFLLYIGHAALTDPALKSRASYVFSEGTLADLVIQNIPEPAYTQLKQKRTRALDDYDAALLSKFKDSATKKQLEKLQEEIKEKDERISLLESENKMLSDGDILPIVEKGLADMQLHEDFVSARNDTRVAIQSCCKNIIDQINNYQKREF